MLATMRRACLLSGLWVAAALAPAAPGVPPAPPDGFFALDGAAFEGSIALVPSLTEDSADRALLWAFAEPSPGGASLAVGRVELPLTTGPQGRAAVTSAVARHLRAELGAEASVERSALVEGPRGARLEVRAHVKSTGGARDLRFSFIPGGAFYHVVVSSAGEERSRALEARLDPWIERLPLAPAVRARPPSAAMRVAALGAAGAVAAAALRLWWRARRGGARPRGIPEARR